MADVYRCTIQTRVDDIVSAITLHYEQSGGSTGPLGAQNCAASVANALVGPLADMLATNTTIEGVTARRIKPLPGTTGMKVLADVPGIYTGDALPAISCLVLNLRNASGLLKRPGRIFISGCSKESVLTGQWRAAWLTAEVTAFGAAILSVGPGGGGDFSGVLVVPRYVNLGVPVNPPTIVYVDTVDHAVTVARQIRRKSKQLGG